MSQAQSSPSAAAAVNTVEGASPLLDQLVEATEGNIQRDQVAELARTLAEKSLLGLSKWDKNVGLTLKKTIAAIDEMVSKQLAAVMHHEKFVKFEGSVRGLHSFIRNTPRRADLKIKVLNCSKASLAKDLENKEADQNVLFKRIYDHEYGILGGHPFGALVGDYEFSNSGEDVDLLRRISGVCASAQCPFISSASPTMFGMKSYLDLNRPTDLSKIFAGKDYASWNSFRETEDSRYITLTVQKTISRLPYGTNGKKIDDFNYEEFEPNKEGKHEHYCWSNSAYTLAGRLTSEFAASGWCSAICGVEGGGAVGDLPLHVFTSANGDKDYKCPTEIAIPDRREKELSDLGFAPLSHRKNTDKSVFIWAPTCQKPKVYGGPNGSLATENAWISAQLPYMMASTRVSHYLKVIARDRIGSLAEASDVQDYLNNWIADYVAADPKPDIATKRKYPMREARIQVSEIPGKPGAYRATAHLRPWLFFTELSAAVSMVTQLPPLAKK